MVNSASAPTRLRPRSRANRSSSFMSKLALFACVLVALICFLPAVKAEDKDNDYGTVIGIDLGTTYSCVA